MGPDTKYVGMLWIPSVWMFSSTVSCSRGTILYCTVPLFLELYMCYSSFVLCCCCYRCVVTKTPDHLDLMKRSFITYLQIYLGTNTGWVRTDTGGWSGRTKLLGRRPKPQKAP